MNASLLVEAEISRHPWSSLREANGFADDIPSALRALLSAQSPAEGERAYWRIENHVVVQGQLFEAAVATTQVLIAALVDDGRPGHVRIGILELLFQIVSGKAHEHAIARGATDLGEKCRNAAREGLWILYRELVAGEAAAAREVLDVIDRERTRLVEIDRLSESARAWIQAGRILTVDPKAQVRCPEKGDGILTVHDEVSSGDPTMLERYLVCDACGARNVIRMRASVEPEPG